VPPDAGQSPAEWQAKIAWIGLLSPAYRYSRGWYPEISQYGASGALEPDASVCRRPPFRPGQASSVLVQ